MLYEVITLCSAKYPPVVLHQIDMACFSAILKADRVRSRCSPPVVKRICKVADVVHSEISYAKGEC